MKTSFLRSLPIAFAAIFLTSTVFGQFGPQPGPYGPQPWNQQNNVGGIIQPASSPSVYQSPMANTAGMHNQTMASPVAVQGWAQGSMGEGMNGSACEGCSGNGQGCCGGGGCEQGGCSVGGCGGMGRGCRGNGCGGCRAGGLGSYDPCCSKRYFSFFGGGVEYEDINFNLGLFGPDQQNAFLDAPLDLNDGYVIGGAVGRTLGRRFRAEMEFSYRNARLESAGVSINGQPQALLDLDGTLNQYAAMPNLLVDLNPGGRFNLYGGFGAGVVFNDLDGREPTTPLGIRLRASSFAYQGIVGVSTRIRCRLEPFAEYRYFGTDKLQIDAAAPIGSAEADVDITSSNILFGFRMYR